MIVYSVNKSNHNSHRNDNYNHWRTDHTRHYNYLNKSMISSERPWARKLNDSKYDLNFKELKKINTRPITSSMTSTQSPEIRSQTKTKALSMFKQIPNPSKTWSCGSSETRVWINVPGSCPIQNPWREATFPSWNNYPPLSLDPQNRCHRHRI